MGCPITDIIRNRILLEQESKTVIGNSNTKWQKDAGKIRTAPKADILKTVRYVSHNNSHRISQFSLINRLYYTPERLQKWERRTQGAQDVTKRPLALSICFRLGPGQLGVIKIWKIVKFNDPL